MCKKFLKKVNKMMKRMTWVDGIMLKTMVLAFTLMVAKLWSPILSLEWYWYGLVFAVLDIILVKRLRFFDLFK